MTLLPIVRTMGGDIYAGGRRANIPAPGHSPQDRSVSLMLTETGRLVVKTFNGEDWRIVLDDLRRRSLIDRDNRITGRLGPAPVRPVITDRERISAARRLWDEAGRAARSLTERHVRLRMVGRELPGDETLRHCSRTPVSAYAERGPVQPAMLVAIRSPQGEMTAVEVTYLAPDGRRASRLRLPRKMIGVVPPGSAVRIDAPQAEMLVGEGFFTTLSASERFGLPAWALLSAGNLRTFVPPAYVRSVLIAGDNGRDGVRSARLLETRLRSRGLSTQVVFPPADVGDFNEAAGGAL